jgi:hypothetical protein
MTTSDMGRPSIMIVRRRFRFQHAKKHGRGNELMNGRAIGRREAIETDYIMQLHPRDACPNCGARSSRPAGLRRFRLSRPDDRKCDACGKIFLPPTFAGDGIGVLFIGAALIVNTVWTGLGASLFASAAGTVVATSMVLLGLALIGAGIWNLLRCVRTRNDSVRGFDISLTSSDSAKPPAGGNPP